jgi:hypothetical protein
MELVKRPRGRPKKVKPIDGNVELRRKRGRPQEFFYTEEKAEKMLAVMARGGNKPEICVALGVSSENTITNNLAKDPIFKADYEYGLLLSKKFFNDLFMDVITSPENPKYKNFNTKLAMWIAANKHNDVYSHNLSTGSVSIGSINTVNTTESKALEYSDVLRQLEQFSNNKDTIKQLTEEEVEIDEH